MNIFTYVYISHSLMTLFRYREGNPKVPQDFAIMPELTQSCRIQLHLSVVKVFIYMQTVILKEGNLMYNTWRDLPIPIYMQFYMFDCLNPEEVLNGAKPYVVEKGPYTYM